MEQKRKPMRSAVPRTSRCTGLLRITACIVFSLLGGAGKSFAQTAVVGRVLDSTKSALPGVTVEAVPTAGGKTAATVTAIDGSYAIAVQPGRYDLAFRLMNFATSVKKGVDVGSQPAIANATLFLSANSEIVVTGKQTFHNLAEMNEPINGLIGIADAATVGVITAEQIEGRPAQRAGDVLESVPGVVISQHSGEGKANQYYLRGFNLDHGTDIAITVAGVPVNMPTHAHGQGYADANFLIPELISGVQFRKGPYYAEDGDFASAGSVNVNYTNSLEHGIALVDGGSFGFQRALVANSPKLGLGTLLYAVEVSRNNGPWTHPDDYHKLNGVLRYTRGNEQSGFSLTAMGYGGKWNSTDQVAERAVTEGVIGRFGELDPTDGGRSHRYTGSAAWQQTRQNSLTKVEAYAIDYSLDLFSNFTYFLEDPVNGDQFHQEDRRNVTGLKARQQWISSFGTVGSENLLGVDVRNDNIPHVALFKTKAREELRTVRNDSVLQNSEAIYYQNSLQWSEKFRTVIGAREDLYRFRVRSDNPANSGRARDSLFSPKISIIAGPWNNTEVYGNYGYGFHSNDGRGSTLTEDPDTHEPADRVSLLVPSKGAELGVRTTAIPHIQSTLSFWGLDVASELVFSGDAGSTEASRPSRRAGIEFANYYQPVPWVTVDADFIYSHSRFTAFDPVGAHIPGAPGEIVSAGILFHPSGALIGGLRFRYFGPRPLIEDDSVRSRPSRLVEGRVGYELVKGYRLNLDVFNLLNAKVSDIDYFYTSRLRGEPAVGMNDVHTHPVEPRSFRVGITRTF